MSLLNGALRNGALAIVLITQLARADDAETMAARGEVLAGLAGCEACHTADDGPSFAGGHRIETPRGTFIGTNITPDPDAGIGAWREQDFVRALRRGRSPSGRAYWPAFPYPSFHALTDDDLADLWAYLQRVPASARPNAPQEPARSNLGGLGRMVWRSLYFSRRTPLSWAGTPEDRGRYLVEVVGHCAECHTPRGKLGQLRRGEGLAGQVDPPAPDIRATTLSWSTRDWSYFLEDGLTPEGDVVSASMLRVVHDGTARLSKEDRGAIAAYLAN